MSHFENGPLARRQTVQNLPDSSPKLQAEKLALRISVGSRFFHCIHSIQKSFTGLHHRVFLTPYSAFPECVQAQISDNPVQPGMKAAVESKCMQVLEHPQKRLLINIVGVLGRPKQIHGQPQDVLIVQAHQLLEGALIAPLSCPNQLRFVHSNGRLGHCRLQHLDRRRINKNVTG
jgi:hypothetical protein